jgi:hypothetical protein
MPEIAKKSSDEQFLQGSRNWEKCSALEVALVTQNPFFIDSYKNYTITLCRFLV